MEAKQKAAHQKSAQSSSPKMTMEQLFQKAGIKLVQKQGAILVPLSKNLSERIQAQPPLKEEIIALLMKEKGISREQAEARYSNPE